MMFATRKDIHDYAVAHKIPFREDSSNRSTKYLRNKVRLGVIPMFKDINPQFVTIMRRNISRLSQAQGFINAAMDLIKRSVLQHEGDIDRLNTSAIDTLLPRNFVIYEILNSEYGFKGDVVDQLCRALDSGATGRRFYSPSRVAVIDRGDILIMPITEDDDCEVVVEKGCVRSYIGGNVLYYEYIDIDFVDSLDLGENVALLDGAKLKFPLRLRRWRDGDWFVPLGMSGRKKISDYLTDKKVPLVEKSRQFVLLSGDDIVWVVGRRIDDRYCVKRSTENVLKVIKERL
jgi:tRNA(Ile)-lysidine synthase